MNERKWNPYLSAKNNGDFISIKSYSGYSLKVADYETSEHLLSIDVWDKELGIAIKEALKNSRHLSLEKAAMLEELCLKNYPIWIQNMMEKYRYKTKRALFKNMKSCSIEQKNEEGVLVIEPSHHYTLEGWSGDGFTEADYVKIPIDSSPEEIGAALRLAFSRCTGKGAYQPEKD